MTVCECERSTGATLGQVLLLANSEEMENKIADGNGRVARFFKDKKPAGDMIEELLPGRPSGTRPPRPNARN